MNGHETDQTPPIKFRRGVASGAERIMRMMLAAVAALASTSGFADSGAPLASHRAGYEISLGGLDTTRPERAPMRRSPLPG